MITSRGILIILLGTFLLASGFAYTNFYLLTIGSALILSTVIGLPFFEVSASGKTLSVIRTLDKKKVFAKDFLHVTITVKNESSKSLDYLHIDDGYPEAFELIVGRNKIETRIEAKSEKSFSYIIQPRLRGNYKIGPTRLRIHDRLNYHFVERVVSEFTDLLVYPTYEDVRRMEAVGKQRHLGLLFGAHKTVIKGMGTDFAGIREYQPSDGLRFIDWKSTARSRTIMTREFETEKNIRVIVFLDSSGSMGAGVLENSKLEYAIRSAVILSKLALERRDLVGLISFNDAVRNYVAAKMGKKHFYRILDTLALVQASGGVRMHDAVEYILKRATRASFYIFLTDLEGDSADIIDAIKYARAFKNRILVISP
ncbi:MAG: DUF58 domain-containing protein, partial [Candidatus Heimdallarchaeota archaeon]|nr:DUF58 domain-containing protein [Candidatus Heimdallarchaeota archaeon]